MERRTMILLCAIMALGAAAGVYSKWYGSAVFNALVMLLIIGIEIVDAIRERK